MKLCCCTKGKNIFSDVLRKYRLTHYHLATISSFTVVMKDCYLLHPHLLVWIFSPFGKNNINMHGCASYYAPSLFQKH